MKKLLQLLTPAQTTLWQLVLLLSLGQLARIQITQSIALYIHDILLVVWVGYWLLARNRTISQFFTSVSLHPRIIMKYVKIVWRREKSGFLFMFWVLLGMIMATLKLGDLVPWLYAARIGLYILAAYSFSQEFKHDLLLLRAAAATSGLILLILGILQYMMVPDTRFLAVLGWDDHYYRLIGPLFDPGFTGLLFVITYAYVLQLAEHSKQKLQSFFALIGLTAGIALTYSRATYLAWMLVVGLLAGRDLINKHRKTAEGVLQLGAVLFAFLSVLWLAPKPSGEGVDLTRTSTISARTATVTHSLQSLSGTDLIFGQGLFTHDQATNISTGPEVLDHARLPDNIFIQLLVQTGLVGLVLGLLFGIKLLQRLFKKDYILAVVLSAVLLHNMFNAALLQPFVLLFLLLGVASSPVFNSGRNFNLEKK